MTRDAKWQKFEDCICEKLKEIDPNIRGTKGSGNSTEKGDLRNSIGLHIECKDYSIDSVYKEEWMAKVIAEVPLHAKKLPVLFTRNKNGKMRAHLDCDDFIRLYIEHYNFKLDMGLNDE